MCVFGGWVIGRFLLREKSFLFRIFFFVDMFLGELIWSIE